MAEKPAGTPSAGGEAAPLTEKQLKKAAKKEAKMAKFEKKVEAKKKFEQATPTEVKPYFALFLGLHCYRNLRKRKKREKSQNMIYQYPKETRKVSLQRIINPVVKGLN